MFKWLKQIFSVEKDTFWEDRLREQRDRFARETFAKLQGHGIIVTDDSEVDGIRYGDLHKSRDLSD